MHTMPSNDIAPTHVSKYMINLLEYDQNIFLCHITKLKANKNRLDNRKDVSCFIRSHVVSFNT